MTEQERIKRLAEWMGWYPVPGWIKCGVDDEGDDEIITLSGWNPLQNIQDAWMLVEKARELGWWCGIWHRQGLYFRGTLKDYECKLMHQDGKRTVYVVGPSDHPYDVSEAICAAIEKLIEENGNETNTK